MVLQIWYSHSRWHMVGGGGGPAAAAAVLIKARAALPDCLMLLFAAAELEETRGESETARGLYEEQVQVPPPFLPIPPPPPPSPPAPSNPIASLTHRRFVENCRESMVAHIVSSRQGVL